MSKKSLLPCLVLCLLVFGLSCDSASPVAPTGTLLSISASPNEISANGSSTIRVTALRANGTPVNPGTIVRLDTTIGTIDESVETDEQGEARATLRGTGEFGTATVTARSGSAESATVDVTVGEVASAVSLQATPSVLGDQGGRVALLAVVRDNDGEPLADATANFQTPVGRLQSQGSLLRTDASGEVRDTLIVDDIDLADFNSQSFTVTVEIGAGGSTISDTTAIRVNTCEPTVNFTAENIGNRSARIEDSSTGEDPLRYEWDKDSNGTIDSNLPNPGTFQYDTIGEKQIRLTLKNDCGEDSNVVFVTVTDQAPS